MRASLRKRTQPDLLLRARQLLPEPLLRTRQLPPMLLRQVRHENASEALRSCLPSGRLPMRAEQHRRAQKRLRGEVQDRATIEATFTVDHAHKKPNLPAND